MTTSIGNALAARIRMRRRSDAWQHPAVAEHSISVTREHAGGDVLSVATCKCGRWRSRVELSEIADQDAAIEAHRRDVIAAAGGIAA